MDGRLVLSLVSVGALSVGATWMGCAAPCHGESCADPCLRPSVQSACASASAHLQDCCRGTLTTQGAVDLCRANIAAGLDPAATCQAQINESCDQFHESYLTTYGTCCCPDGQACDSSAGNACAPRCNSAADCTGAPGRPTCAPGFGLVNGSAVVSGPYICVPTDGNPGHGCNGFVACVGSGWYCASDSQANRFCSSVCASDSGCGNPGTACCDVAVGTSPACGLCGRP